MPNSGEAPLVHGRPRLFLLSFLMLFVELALIRWLGANVVYLSYFSNFVLLGSFLGIGIGFLRARSARDLSELAPVVLGVLLALVLIFPINIQHGGGQLIYFGFGISGPPVWITLPIVFLVVDLSTDRLVEELGRTEPLSKTRSEDIWALRAWAKERAVPA